MKKKGKMEMKGFRNEGFGEGMCGKRGLKRTKTGWDFSLKGEWRFYIGWWQGDV
jgi:hypothetical protein